MLTWSRKNTTCFTWIHQRGLTSVRQCSASSRVRLQLASCQLSARLTLWSRSPATVRCRRLSDRLSDCRGLFRLIMADCHLCQLPSAHWFITRQAPPVTPQPPLDICHVCWMSWLAHHCQIWPSYQHKLKQFVLAHHQLYHLGRLYGICDLFIFWSISAIYW